MGEEIAAVIVWVVGLVLTGLLLLMGLGVPVRIDGGPGLPGPAWAGGAVVQSTGPAPAFLPHAGDGPWPTAGVAAPMHCSRYTHPVLVAGIAGCAP